ncbi:MAG: tRNA (adenosine(37)-N6)-dimethylallyltransferase MiaA [Bacteroidales bacterium]
MQSTYSLVSIIGATASSKTKVAALLANAIDGEIISADSRQVYKGMNLGTGKDYEDYIVNKKHVPYHLIDIVSPGHEYNIFEYQQDFTEAYGAIKSRNKYPIMCGGSGLYVESILKNYRLLDVPSNKELRDSLKDKSLEGLIEILKQYKSELHNKTDIETHRRATRAIEIEEYYAKHPTAVSNIPKIKSLIVGIKYDREQRRKRITERLQRRFREGMSTEVEALLESGVKPETLIYYGLEYKFVTLYIIGEISKQEMEEKLNVAIHQFAKRQMTWFRGMERRGFHINWIDGNLPHDEKVKSIINMMREKT